jgi:hypothetical protein
MDFFYDGQIRRYVTQFMRVFIGFKYQTGDGEQRHVPVMYGDMTRQVASIIKENSENKMATVPRIACYITGLEMDTTRLSDATFVSKLNIRERAYTTNNITGEPVYDTYQGGGYTVERLMPTPFKLTMKADLWTSNTDQKLQLLEQILVLFNPSLEIQTTDNYIDWSSLSVIDLGTINFSSRTIPQGAETEIDICTMEFSMPIYINPPAKVKKLGIVKSIIANVFTESGDVMNLNQLVYNGNDPNLQIRITIDNRTVLLMKSPNINNDNEFYLTFPDDSTVDWNTILDLHGGYTPTSLIYFDQPTGNSITGTFEVNELDTKTLIVMLDMDTVPSNNLTPIDRIVDPYNFNPITFYNGNIPVGTRLLTLENINDPDIARVGADDAWINLDSAYAVIKANSIIEWDGTAWRVDFDPGANNSSVLYVTNLTSKVQYRWDGLQWLRSFEGEYAPGYWRLQLDS